MTHNFYAGPAILPSTVINKAAESVNNFNNSGLSILEISHRSKDFIQVMENAEQNVRKILDINEDYAVLFLTGGASSQFYMTAMNLLDSTDSAAYIDTGSWSSKAIKEAGSLANIEIAGSSADKNYSYIPTQVEISNKSKYLHITSNNTIYGTQYQQFPEVNIPLVCDMSSDIFSRKVPMEKIGLLYAGAQKNMGPAGTTLVVVRKDLLGKVQRSIPTMLRYETHIAKGSMFNTPPVFPIYVSMLTMDWILDLGGPDAMAKRNSEKAELLYGEIDRNPCFKGTADKKDRSKMNICFLATKEEFEAPFLKECADADIVGIKGHRSVGGFRASVYNAMEISSVRLLVNIMKEFAQKYG